MLWFIHLLTLLVLIPVIVATITILKPKLKTKWLEKKTEEVISAEFCLLFSW